MNGSILWVLALASPAFAGTPGMGGEVGGAERSGIDEALAPARQENSGGIPADRLVNYVVNGETTLDYQQVVGLMAMHEDRGVFVCSSTQVSPNDLVTAAHCIDDLQAHLSVGATPTAVWGGDLYAGDVLHRSELVDWQSHPNWTGSSVEGADIAVISFRDAYRDHAPMPLFQGSALSVPTDEVLDFVGFGVTGDGRDDFGTKRTAAIRFRRVQGDFMYSEDPRKNLCTGDSGGAALRRVNGAWELIGVNSFVYDTVGDVSSCFTGGNGVTRIDLYREWIYANTDAIPDGDSDNPSTSPESRASACNSVGAGGGAAVGLAGLLLGVARRRRR